jgi:tRNA (adenine-N(1)-)-methyltransferase non-catalytic subunit
MVSYCCNRIKRKEKKYNRQIRVMKATPATVCDVYHYKNKDKTCNLRIDSLAQILSLGNICSGKAIGTIVFILAVTNHSNAGMRVLVIESTIGLVTASIAYKMRGNGIIAAPYYGQQPHMQLVEYLNIRG